MNRAGAEEEQLTAEPGNYRLPRVAPDGRRAIVSASGRLQIVDPTNGSTTSFVADANYAGTPVEWAPDGQAVAAAIGNPRSLVLRSVNGSEVRTLVPASAQDVFGLSAQSFTPDGQGLVFTHQGERNSRDISVVSLLRPDDIRPLLHTRFNELNAQISPGGRWIVYQSDESGRYQVYVRPFPDVEDDRWLISPDEGRTPVWSRDSRELFYLAPGNQLMAVPIMSGPEHQLLTGSLVRLFEARYYGGFFEGGSAENNRHFDVTPEGRFLMVKTLPSETNSMRIIVVQNWLEELKRLATID